MKRPPQPPPPRPEVFTLPELRALHHALSGASPPELHVEWSDAAKRVSALLKGTP